MGGLALEDGGGLVFDNDLMTFVPDPRFDLSGADFAGNAYSDLAITADGGQCVPGATGTPCANALPANAGCVAQEDCGTGSGNGLDDDCNGTIDDTCSCTPGEVKRCFAGPPGKRGVGGCTEGTMTCVGSVEFGTWGNCEGSIGPSSEACDNLDNDCNGCADDNLCCQGGMINCPAPGDSRIADVPPFFTKPLNGADFFSGTAVSWNWKIDGGPCDRLFRSPDFMPTTNQQSYTLTNANAQNATVQFTLSGDYTVTLTVVDSQGTTHTCKWVQHVIGPGVRFELCWDRQGKLSGMGNQPVADLDLHVHKSGTTTTWFTNGGKINPDDCYYYNCLPQRYSAPPVDLVGGAAIVLPYWYANTALSNCGDNPKYGRYWRMAPLGFCANPRLDLDNYDETAKPENTNIDNPGNGDKFRAMVHYYGQGGFATSAKEVETHPIVNIYCGGVLKATYGQKPDQVAGFNWGSGFAKGQMWRVADVTAIVNGSGVTTDCTVSALHPSGSNAGYWVVTDRNNTDLSY